MLWGHGRRRGLTDKAMWRRTVCQAFSPRSRLDHQDIARGGHRFTPVWVCSECRGPGYLNARPTAMRAFSLILAIVQIVAVASANRYYSPISGCQVTLDNYRFDLCPLLDKRNNSGHVHLVLHHQTPPTITTIVYNISLNGPLLRSDAIADDEVSLVLCITAANLISLSSS